MRDVDRARNRPRTQGVFAKRQKLGEDVIGFAYTIKTRALVRLGQLLKDVQKNVGAVSGAGPGRGKRGAKQEPRFNAPPTLAEIDIDKKTSMVAQELASLPAATREAIAQQETTIAKVRRETKAVELLVKFAGED